MRKVPRRRRMDLLLFRTPFLPVLEGTCRQVQRIQLVLRRIERKARKRPLGMAGTGQSLEQCLQWMMIDEVDKRLRIQDVHTRRHCRISAAKDD